MTFLGLEKPVGYEVQLIFDPTMAKMVLDALDLYIAAARGEYERGLLDIKDFTNTYGDFMSPFAKDMARYNQMISGVRNIIDDAYAHGIDLTKSPQGRAIIQRAINSVNPAEYNAMRANAKVGYAYLDAALKLRSQGKYSEALELFDILLSGGLGMDSEGNEILNFADFSTAGNGSGWNMFSRTSPIEAASLRDLTKGGYEGRLARLLSEADFNDPRLVGKYLFDPRYEWSGYLYSDLMKGAPGAILSASADPRMQYFRNLAEQKVASSGRPYTQADVEEQFQRDVADANTWALIDPTRKANDFAVLQQQLRNTLTSQQHSKALDNYYNMIEAGADTDGDGKLSTKERLFYSMMKTANSSGYSYDPSTGMMVSPSGNAIEFTDYRRMGSDVNRATKILLNIGQYLQQMIDREQADIDLYNNYLEENRTGYRQSGTTTTQNVRVPGMMGYSPSLNITYTPQQKISKHSESEMSKLRKRAKAAKFMVDMYKSYLNEDGSPNYEKLKDRGYFDENYQPTKKLMVEINKLNKNNSYLSESERRKRAEDTYMLYAGSAPQPGTESHKRLLKDFAGEDLVKVPGLPNEMLKVNLNHYQLSAIRRGDATGANVYGKDSKIRKALEWLLNNKVEGYVDDRYINDAWIPNRNGDSIQNDNYGEALVDKRYIDRMMEALNIKSESKRKELLDLLGIMAYEKQTTDSEIWTTYYSVPITKTITSGIIHGDRNIAYNKELHGQQQATKREKLSYAAGIQSTLTGQ